MNYNPHSKTGQTQELKLKFRGFISPHLMLTALQAPPPVRTVPGDEGQVLSRERRGPEQQQGRAVASCPVHHQGPAPLHPEQGYGPGPAQCGEAAVQHHVARELSSAGSPPHCPAHKLDQKEAREGQLETVEARARDELGLHRGAIFLVEQAVDGAEEEGEREQDSGDQREVEAWGDAFISPGLGDGRIGFTVALYEPHCCGCGGTEAEASTTTHIGVQLK